MLKLTLAQIDPTIGDLHGNIQLMMDAAMKAERDYADMVIFPEMSLTGYYPGDLLDDAFFTERLAMALTSLLEASRGTPKLHWVIGSPVARQGVGKKFHNCLWVIKDGQVLLQYAKQLLPTYGVFDEARHVAPGADVARVLRLRNTTVGFIVCEDGWNVEGRDYSVNPLQRLQDAGVDLVVSINASPSNIGKREQRHELFRQAADVHKFPIVYVNQVGGQDSLVYDGGSFLIEAPGTREASSRGQGAQVVFEAKRFEVDLPTVAFDRETRQFSTPQGDELPRPSAGGLAASAFFREQIVLGIRDYARRCKFKDVVLGCSGGIDSAVTLALAVEALGPEHVRAITMPSEYSSEGSVSDSEVLCRNYGVRLDHVSIRGMVDAFHQGMLGSTLQEVPTKLAAENLQPRVRGTILMTFSNQHGHLVLTTGNKSEISVGYCTLYGDTNGGLGPIGDLYKTEVFLLASHINAHAGSILIPRAIITKPPSAELAPGQLDTDSLPPYEVLDEILKVLVEGDRLATYEYQTAKATFSKLQGTLEGRQTIERVKQMIARNEYKRRQSPPIVRVRAKAFGSGRQLPIAAVHY